MCFFCFFLQIIGWVNPTLQAIKTLQLSFFHLCDPLATSTVTEICCTFIKRWVELEHIASITGHLWACYIVSNISQQSPLKLGLVVFWTYEYASLRVTGERFLVWENPSVFVKESQSPRGSHFGREEEYRVTNDINNQNESLRKWIRALITLLMYWFGMY